MNPQLQEYINLKIDQPTVILPCRILLLNHKHRGINAKMTTPEIKSEFNAVCTQYGITRFRSDYVLRQCGRDTNGITQEGDHFFIKQEYLQGMSNDDFDNIIQQIDAHWGNIQNQQRLLLTSLQQLLNSGQIDEQKQYIVNMLTAAETVKKGQAFEVASFSVLSIYLSSLGFTLHRYSTTYSNDGGIDFGAQNVIYQVTTNLSESKFQEDLKKAPGMKRIFVYRAISRNFNPNNFENELVVNHISKDDLCALVDYLSNKNSAKFLCLILNTMLAEFKREFHQ